MWASLLRLGRWWQCHLDRWLEPSKILIEQSVPDLTAPQIVDEIDIIAQSYGAAGTGWLLARWAKMTPTQRLAWVQRRRALLMIIWMRGGRDGFNGLGNRLQEALEQIDR